MIVSYDNNATHAVRRVYLDGKAVIQVIRADDEAGWVIRYILDDKGYPKLVGDEFATITETGKVEIELNAGWRYDTRLRKFVLLPKELLH